MSGIVIQRLGLVFLVGALFSPGTLRAWPETTPAAAWNSSKDFRLRLQIESRDRKRSNSPASVEIDFQQQLKAQGRTGSFDEHTIEVIPLNGNPHALPAAPQPAPHRLDKLFGATSVTLHFVIPNEATTEVAVYFDTLESHLGEPRRYPGLVGDGDRFCEEYGRREISATHFDCFVDFDGDGDLDLFKGGVGPFVECYENVGRNRLVGRGRLSSDGKVLTLPHSRSNRSWLTVGFFDIDGDGNQDFFPGFGDGPDAGTIVFYRNTTPGRGAPPAFARVGPLQTISGVALGGGAQAGGWFPSIAFASDFDGDGMGPDALVGSNHRCWLYRGVGTNAEGSPRFAEATAVPAGGREIVLVNPRFDVADIDGDGDLDLFAGTQPGAVHWFKNIGTPTRPEFAPGQVVAWSGRYLIGDAHSGVKVADFDGDGLPDIASGRFWERTDLNAPAAPRDFGGFFKNVGTRASPRFERRSRGAPFTEQFQICDVVRQNCVRAVDWDRDGRPDLLAGDTDGFIWFFRNVSPTAQRHWKRGLVSADHGAWFARGERVRGSGQPLNVTATGGHARFDVCDWNNDGRTDLVVADGQGSVTLFVGHGRPSSPAFGAGEKIVAGGKPLQVGARASALVCDWDGDQHKDLVLADEKGYYFGRNLGSDSVPRLATLLPIHFGDKPARYIRPNLGSWVDWDGDGRLDLIGAQFENNLRFYRNLSTKGPGAEPQFSDPEGIVILQGESPQMISGAHITDWNGDGDLDILTGQGHGGSGLRFYERDWIEDELHRTHPVVRVLGMETKPARLPLPSTGRGPG